MKSGHKILAAACSAIMGYTLGMINPAYGISRRKGYDIREKGSGNPGASNTLILEGKKAAAFVTAFDMSKAAVSVSLSRKLFPSYDCSGETAGAAAILGHMFPANMGFRGGKGLACLGGTILAFGLPGFTITLFTELCLLSACRYVCVVPITASVFYPVLHGCSTGNRKGAAILSTVAIPIFFKHIENLKRIAEDKELRIDFLWDKTGELERTGWLNEFD